MQRARIELLPSAEADLDKELDYLSEKDVQTAMTLLNDVEHAFDLLEAFPETAPLSKDLHLARQGYRVLVLKYGYLMFYKVHKGTVFIHRLIDGRRNYGAFV